MVIAQRKTPHFMLRYQIQVTLTAIYNVQSDCCGDTWIHNTNNFRRAPPLAFPYRPLTRAATVL